jgi:hypothetical protein
MLEKRHVPRLKYGYHCLFTLLVVVHRLAMELPIEEAMDGSKPSMASFFDSVRM